MGDRPRTARTDRYRYLTGQQAGLDELSEVTESATYELEAYVEEHGVEG